jgi:RNAse (barnase) inhibitor barstar
MTHTDLFRDPARSGVYRLSDMAAWAPQFATTKCAVWRIDLAKVRSKARLLATLARALDFPEWFGHNWDALQDCLTDLSWRPAPGYVVVLENCEGLAASAPEAFATTLEVCRHAARWWAGEHIPFWVFVGGLADAPCNPPRLDWAE